MNDEPLSEYDFEDVERWASVEGYEGFYEVSSFGQVRSVPHKDGVGNRVSGGKTLSQFSSPAGYKRLELCKEGVRKKALVHRLVAIAWLPNPLKKPCVNHIDNNPANNRVSNLEWCTYNENMAHAEKQDRVKHTFAPGDNLVKLTKADVIAMRNMRKVGASIWIIAELYSMSESAVGRALRGKTWRHIT